MIGLGERLSNIQIDKFGTVAKKLIFFEFPGSYKNTATFSGFHNVLVSVLSVLFFFRAKTLEKLENESCSNEHLRKFFNLDCKTVFNNLCQFHTFCV